MAQFKSKSAKGKPPKHTRAKGAKAAPVKAAKQAGVTLSRGPQTITEWVLSLGLVGMAGLAFGLTAIDATMVPKPDPSVASLAVPSERSANPMGASEADSERPKGGKKTVSPPMLGDAPDAQTLQVIQDGLQPVLDKFPKGSGTGVALLDPSGKVVTGINVDKPMMPASTIKVATGTALWNTFGPDHHFNTKVMVRGDLSPEGVVNGDLYLVGDGDPSIMSELAIAWKVRPPRPTLSMGDIAEAIRKAGVKSVTGSVVGVDTIFHGEPTAKGWKDSYIGEQNATYIHALSVDRGLVIVPKGEKPAKTAHNEQAVYHPTQVGQNEPENYATFTSPDTRLDAAAALTQSLSARGITVGGQPGAADALPVDAKEVTKIPSPALRQMVDWIELRSDNHMADMLVRRLDVQTGGDGSFSSGAAQVIEHVEALGVDTADMVMEDGSGLSRDDRITPTQLAQVVLHMGYTDPDWLGSLAVMGETGTTSNRLKNTPAQGRWHGKTGSLDDVVSYVGAIKDRQNNVWTLAMMANSKEGVGNIEPIHDELLVAIAKMLVPPPSFSQTEA